MALSLVLAISSGLQTVTEMTPAISPEIHYRNLSFCWGVKVGDGMLVMINYS